MGQESKISGLPDPERQRSRIDFAYLKLLPTLPDNVFVRRPDDEPPEPPQTEALAA